MYKYSIIIPVYNAEKYLREAVESIVSQTYEQVEVILINDGSTDDSLTLCYDLKKVNPDKIVVVDTENAGTSAARNRGLSVATGDYIGYLDNDDFWIKKDFLQRVDEQLSDSKADLLVYLCQYFDDRTKSLVPKTITLKREDILGKSFSDAVQLLLEHSVIESAVWVKFVKREIVFENGAVLFPANMRNEDTDWTARVLLKIKSVDYFDEFIYAYRKGTDYAQTSKSLKKAHLLDLKKIIEETEHMAQNTEEPNRSITLKFLSYPYLVLLGQLSVFENIDEFIPFLKEYRYLLKYKKYKYMLPFYIFMKIFGVKLSVYFVGIFFKRLHPNMKHD